MSRSTKDKKGAYCVTLSLELMHRLDRLVTSERSRSMIVNEAIKQYLKFQNYREVS
jgi:predicted transcriptional regulator